MKPMPVAITTGVYGGRFTYVTNEPHVVLPVGMALFAQPKREWVEPDEQDLLNVYNQFTDSDGWTYEKAIIKMCKELNA